MLPMVLGLLGSGLASSGAVAGLSPLIAGAIGSGLGSFAQSGDLGEGIKTGLMSFVGGKALGSVMGGAGGNAAAAPVAADTSQAAMAAAQGAPAAVATTGAMPGPAGGPAPGPAPTSPGMSFDLGRASFTPQNGGDAITGIRSIPRAGMQYGTTAEGIGSSLGAAAAPMVDLSGIGKGNQKGDEANKSQRRFDAIQGYDTSNVLTAPIAGSSAGTTDYGYNKAYGYGMAGGGSLARYANPSMMGVTAKLAEGGLASMVPMGGDMPMELLMDPAMAPQMPADMPASESGMNDKEIIVQAINAIKSGSPNETNQVILAQFVQKYGEQALMDLVESVQSGEFDDIANQSGEGLIRGPGDAMDDLVPAKNTSDDQDILLSGEEFIVPGDVVSGLGNGSTDAGADELYGMMDRVRQARTGTTEQPPKIAAGGMLPA